MPEGWDLVLAVATALTALLWLLAAGALYLTRKPPEPAVGPRTLELGPEPPAVASFLVSDFRVPSEAVPATLLDLAARKVVEVEQRGPGAFYVRLRPEHDETLTPYELRVLGHLHGLAHDNVVPAEALTTGPQESSRRWRHGFEQEVVSDAKRRGLSRDALDGPVFTVLTATAGVPAILAWAASSAFQAGIVVIAAAVAVLGWIRARHPQRETPDGMAAASRWLGVRAELAENEVFGEYSPLTVSLWDRLLAYGAALGLARSALGALPMGVEPDHEAWSSYGGRWRPVRIAYPRFWPLAWGAEPLVALPAGAAAIAGGTLALYFLGPSLVDAFGSGWLDVVPGTMLAIPCAAVLLGVALVAVSWLDLGGTVEITGPIMRLRSFGDDEHRRYYVAVDDGSARLVHAWRVQPGQYTGLEQGELVTVAATPNLGRVRRLVRASQGE
jgi:hypothetical protein